MKGDKERTKGKQGVETERKRHLLMVIFFLMSNSSIGVCVCDHVLVFQCLCVRTGARRSSSREEKVRKAL